MDRALTTRDLDAWLEAFTPAFDVQESQWAQHRLAHRLYVTPAAPPPELTSSVRAVLFKAGRVMVVRDRTPSHHVMPGGRREPGEDDLATLGREVGEETGWGIVSAAPLGFLHFRHLSPRPPDYAYPYPDFFQRLYLAEGGDFDRRRILRDGWEDSSRMMSVAGALVRLPTDQATLLRAAISLRREIRTPGG